MSESISFKALVYTFSLMPLFLLFFGDSDSALVLLGEGENVVPHLQVLASDIALAMMFAVACAICILHIKRFLGSLLSN